MPEFVVYSESKIHDLNELLQYQIVNNSIIRLIRALDTLYHEDHKVAQTAAITLCLNPSWQRSCPSCQRHRTGCCQSPVQTLHLQQDAFACWWLPYCVTLDAVPKQ